MHCFFQLLFICFGFHFLQRKAGAGYTSWVCGSWFSSVEEWDTCKLFRNSEPMGAICELWDLLQNYLVDFIAGKVALSVYLGFFSWISQVFLRIIFKVSVKKTHAPLPAFWNLRRQVKIQIQASWEKLYNLGPSR